MAHFPTLSQILHKSDCFFVLPFGADKDRRSKKLGFKQGYKGVFELRNRRVLRDNQEILIAKHFTHVDIDHTKNIVLYTDMSVRILNPDEAIQESIMNVKYYRSLDFAKLLGCSVATLRHWEKIGKLVPVRRGMSDVYSHRYYTHDQYLEAMNYKQMNTDLINVAYMRGYDQENIEKQRKIIYSHCTENNLEIDEWIQDIAGGISEYKKHGLTKLMNLIDTGKINHLVVVHKDRFFQIGQSLFTDLLNRKNITLVDIYGRKKFSSNDELKRDFEKIVKIAMHSWNIRTHDMIDLVTSIHEDRIKHVRNGPILNAKK